MIVCTLSTPQKQILFQTVSADIMSMSKAGTPFNLKNYVKDIFDLMKKGGFDDGTSLAYASLVPQNIKLLMGMDSSLDDYLEPVVGEVFQAAKKMSDVDYAMKYVGLVKGIDEAGSKEAENQVELDELKKKNAIKANPTENGMSFSAKPNSLNTTTGNSADVGSAHSYGFITFAIDNNLLDSNKSGYYITLMNAKEVIRDKDTPNKSMQSGLAQIITDKFGVPVYFDEQYNVVDSENGSPVFFRLRGGMPEFEKAMTSLQTMQELTKTLGTEDTNIITEQLRAQHQEILKKKKYVEGGKGRKVIQTITGARNGFLLQLKTTDTPNRLPLSEAEDLSSGSIFIDTTETKKKGSQRYFFTRGDHKSPVQFSMNTVESLGDEFLSNAADVILGKYIKDGEVVRITDEFGNPDNENLAAYRNSFRYALFGNNDTLTISLAGDVYIGPEGKMVKVSDDVAEAKQQILAALKTEMPANRPNVINVFDEIKDFIPFFETGSKGLVLKKNGMSNTQYKKFIQKNAITFAKYDSNGKFSEANGYFMLRTPVEEMNRIEAETLKPSTPKITKDNVADILKANPKLVNAGYQALGFEAQIQRFFNGFGIQFKEGESYTDILNKVAYINPKTASADFMDSSAKLLVQLLQASPNIDFPHLQALVENTPEFKEKISAVPDIKKIWMFLREGNRIPIEEWTAYIKEYNKVKNEVLEKYLIESLTEAKENQSELSKYIGKFIEWFKKLFSKAKNLKEITDALVSQAILNNKEIITGRNSLKGKERVTLEKALKESTHGESIIRLLGNYGITLTGSVSAAEQGSIYRKMGKLLHDIDWIVPYDFQGNPEQLLRDTFKGTDLVREFDSPTYYTKTFIVPPVGHTVTNLTFFRPDEYGARKYISTYDVVNDQTGEVVSNYRRYYNVDPVSKKVTEDKEVYNEGLNNVDPNLNASSVDLFFKKDPEIYKAYEVTLSYGQKIKVANWLASFTEKLKYGREKDLVDWANFVTNNFTEQNESVIEDLYSKYLDTNPQSKRGSKEDIEAFRQFVSKEMAKPATPISNEKAEADKLPPIEQNFTDGQGGRKMQPQFSGKSTMDLILSGDRTRTTRAKTDIARMIKDYGLSKIEDLVGRVIRMTDKKGRVAYTRITKVSPFTQEYQDQTWQKEGWEKFVTDKHVGNYPYAIEFELFKPSAPVSGEVSIPTIEELNEDLDILSDLETPEYKAPDDKTLNKLKAQGKINPEVTEEQIKAANKWWYSKENVLNKYISYQEIFDMINAENPESIATFKRDAITLYKGSNSTDVYHEAWHAFTQRFLTEKERKDMYAEVGKMKGSFTDYNGNTVEFSNADESQLEEYLAEDFRKFMLSGGKMPAKVGPKVKSIFEKILDILKILFGYDLTDGFSNNQASFSLNETYNNLKIGNIRPTPFAFEKTQPESLNKINPVSERYKSLSETLSYSDAMEVVDSLDSFFSEHSDLQNRVNGTSEFTSILLSSPKERANAYNGALLRIINEYRAVVPLRKEASKAGDRDEFDRLMRKEKILEFVIANFSPKSTKGQTITAQDIIDAEKSNTGIIAYHMQKSKYLTFEDRFQIEDIEDKVKDDKDGYSHRSGNEKSMKELAATEVLYTIRSLFEYKDGKPIKNSLGFNKLVKFDVAWNRIQQTLEDKFDIGEQYQALSEAAATDPMMRQLVSKLGNPNRYANSDFMDQDKSDKTGIIMLNNLWTNFRNALGGRRIPLVQLTIDIVTDPKTKESSIEVKPGKAQAETQKIARDFDAAFSSPVIISSRQRYIKTKPKDATVKELEKFKGNELNIDNVVEDFERKYITDPAAFLRAVGMDIPEGQKMRDILTGPLSIFPKALMEKLLYIKKYNDAQKASKKPSNLVKITSVSELVDMPLNGKTERGGYNELLRYIAKYSDKYGSTMVSTAAGDARWELSLRSTASQMVDSWNNAESYSDLITMARMSHLDVNRNPHIQGLILTRDAFGDDLSTKSARIKRSGRQRQAGIELLNSSGVALLSNGEFTGFNTDSVEADPITQTLQNFYSYVIYGVSEGTRHADKSTSYWYKIKFANGNKHFIPMSEFANYSSLTNAAEDAATTDGMRTAINQFLRYISGEVSRVNKLVNENDASGTAVIGDRTFKELGSELVIFEDVLSPELREEIKSKHLSNNFYEQLTTDPKLAKLKTDIENSVSDYLRQQVDAFKNDLQNINLLKRDMLMKSLRSEITSSTKISNKIKANPEQYLDFIDEALITGYVVNDWIQKFETTALLYGDPALYNHLKEEFHKRNAGIAATGTIPRSDEAMNGLLNGAMAGRYINSSWFKASGLSATQPVHSGILNSAILEDTKTASVYTADYINAAIEYEKKRRGVKKLDADTLAEINESFSEYNKMKEGDAQGWITFDSYRALLNRLGKWSPYQEDMYNQIMDGKTVSVAELSKFFPIKKMQYWGPLKTDTGIPVMAFHKFSLMPLIPTVVKGTNLEILHNKMVSQNIDYATFQSGSKIGSLTKDGKIDKFYKDKSGKDRSIPAFAEADYTFTPNPIFLDYMKDQLEIADDYKGKVIFSTQLRKLVEIGLMEYGVPTDFEPKEKNVQKRIVKWQKALSEGKTTNNYDLLVKYEGLVAKLTEYKKRELSREADVKYNAQGVAILSEKLLQFVKDELTRQELAEHEIDFIKYDDQKGELVYDLSLHPSADRIERLLTALVYKRLIRQKINGEALIQVSGVGFEPANIRKATEEEKERYGTNFLPFYRKKADGTTAAMKVKIAIQGDFKKLLKHPDVIKLAKERKITTLEALNELIRDENWLDKGENRQMVTISGVRIPVQGINSMEFAEVYEFLPENAGNMIILPTEIVGKSGSDFDIDKLTMMFPSIVATSKGVSIVKYDSKYEGQEEARREELDKLYKKKDNVQDKIMDIIKREEEEGTINVRKEIKDAITKLKTEKTNLMYELSYNITNYDVINQSIDSVDEQLNELFDGLYNISAAVKKIKSEELDPIINAIDEQKVAIASGSSKGIENDLLNTVIDILRLEQNFTELVTPNSTSLLTPLAERYSEFARDYNSYETINNNGESYMHNGKKRISATRIFELGYNRYKQISNSIGKKTLGMGAVDNTYNSVFNRINFYMNPYFSITDNGESVDISQTIRMPHNTIKVEGLDAISLAGLYDVNNKNNIAKIISQMINGWVDVAKDSWIFDIQGNVEVSPTLLFMIQAGVPLDQAVAFVSQPSVRRYVDKQRFMKSTFGVTMGVSPDDAQKYRSSARREMLKEMGLNKFGDLKTKNQKKTLYTKIIPAVLNTAPENTFDLNKLDSRIMNQMADADVPLYDMRTFLHFLELEDMASATTEVKLSMNFDTTKTTSLYAAREKLAKSYKLDTNDRIPSNIRELIQKNSSIGSFNVQPYMINLLSNLFPLRDSSEFRYFIAEEVDNYKFQWKMPGAFKNKEQFINAFRNDFTSYMFQRYIYDPKNFDIKAPYKGATISADVTGIAKLKYGAFVKKEDKGYVMYVDFSQINRDFETKAYAKESFRDEYGLAPVSETYFKSGSPEVSKNSYYKFVYERESLRQMIPYKTYNTTLDFKERVKELKLRLQAEENESAETFEKRLGQRAYEEYLRDTALLNKINIPFMMKDINGYAKKFIEIDAMYSELKNTYRILSSLRYVNNKSSRNLRFSENILTADEINMYHDDLLKLANPNVVKVSDPIENQRISNIFSLFPIFAFIQSGQDTKGVYSLGKIISTDQIAQILDAPREEFLDGLTEQGYLDEYWEAFKKQHTRVLTEEGTLMGKKRMKVYYNYSDTGSVEGAFVKPSDNDNSVLLFDDGITKYDNFEPAVKNWVESSPENSIMVYEGAMSDYDLKKADTGRLKDKYTNTVIRDLVAKGEVPAEKVFGLTLKKRGYITSAPQFMTVKTDDEFENFKKSIDKEIERLIELRDDPVNPKTLIFSSKGYGLSLLGYGRTETETAADLILKDPPAARAYKYLSELLYDNFGYVNPGFLEAKAGEYVTENLPVTDSEIKDLIYECYYS